jgi:uncharacterized membrane protein
MSGVIAMIAPLVAFLAVGWVLVLVAAPLLPAVPAAVLYVLGSRICHQIAERSFHVDGAQLPVCARCTGIYVGLAIAALCATVAVPGCDAAASGRPRQGLVHVHSRLRWVLVFGALPTLLTVFAEWAGIWQPSNVVRAIAGAPLGSAVALALIAAIRE